MKKFYYDLHIHSCLSPCADNDNTPGNIAGMASLCGIDILALTDHNSCKNCPAFFEAARNFEIVPIAGMELTTAEDIHLLCLFEELEAALEFSDSVDKNRVRIKNRAEIFGEQLICDRSDNIIGFEEDLLPNATLLDLTAADRLVKNYGGICYPAHIDRQANGIISVLGAMPESPVFDFAEYNLSKNIEDYTVKYGLSDKKTIVSSDAHYLTDFRDKESYFNLSCDDGNETEIRHELFKYLRGEK